MLEVKGKVKEVKGKLMDDSVQQVHLSLNFPLTPLNFL